MCACGGRTCNVAGCTVVLLGWFHSVPRACGPVAGLHRGSLESLEIYRCPGQRRERHAAAQPRNTCIASTMLAHGSPPGVRQRDRRLQDALAGAQRIRKKCHLRPPNIIIKHTRHMQHRSPVATITATNRWLSRCMACRDCIVRPRLHAGLCIGQIGSVAHILVQAHTRGVGNVRLLCSDKGVLFRSYPLFGHSACETVMREARALHARCHDHQVYRL